MGASFDPDKRLPSGTNSHEESPWRQRRKFGARGRRYRRNAELIWGAGGATSVIFGTAFSHDQSVNRELLCIMTHHQLKSIGQH